MEADQHKRRERSTPWFNYVGDFFNTLKAFIGTNYMALPYAFAMSGLMLGICGVFVIAVLTDYCCNLLVRSKYLAIERLVNAASVERALGAREERQMRADLARSVSYGDLGGLVLGRWARILIDFAVAVTQFLTITCYYIFLGNAFFTLFPAEYDQIPLNSSKPIISKPGFVYGSEYDVLDGLSAGMHMLDVVHLDHQDRWYHEDLDSQQSRHTREVSVEYFPTYHNVALPSEYNSNMSTTTQSPNTTTTIAPNTTTTIAPNTTTTIAPNTTTVPPITTPLPEPKMYIKYLAPDMMYLMMIPLAWFMMTSLVRKLRWLSPLTTLATLTLFAGAISVFVFLLMHLIHNGIHPHMEWVKLSTVPLFIGQLIASYEGIGCLLPIESSMEGNRKMFPGFIHGAVWIVWVILTSFGVVGYLGYGDNVEQVILKSMSEGEGVHRSLMVNAVTVTMIISVLCTYPLQAFPVIGIVEGYLFGSGCCARKASQVTSHSEVETANSDPYTSMNADDSSGLIERSSSSELEDTCSAEVKEVTLLVSPETPAWQRNIVRLLITLAAMGCAILFSDSYALVSAFAGAIGASLLAYILPCLIHYELTHIDGSRFCRVLDIIIIILAASASLMTIVVIVIRAVDPHIFKL